VAPLEEIVELGQRHRVRVLVDESHSLGALGPAGRGALADAGLEDEVDVIVGPLGKALGSYGAFVACDRVMTQYLLNAARTMVFSAAPAPPAVAAALAALELLEERPRLVAKLKAGTAALRGALAGEGFDVGGTPTHIVPLAIGDPELALRMFEAALSRGVFAEVVGPPAATPAASGLRLSVMASHREEELRAAAAVLGRAARAVGFDPRSVPVLDEAYDDVAYDEPDLDYEIEAEERDRSRPYEEVDPSVPYDFEQVARAA
jgi:7-keto-8-aminopelargonate synthetase-like enzyme